MNIGIDLLRYRPGCVGGGETYLLSYLNELAEREENVVLFAGPHNAAPLAERYPSFRVLVGPDVLDPSTRMKSESEVVQLMDGAGCDVLYFPLSTVWPTSMETRIALTLFDVQHWDHPENFAADDYAFRDRIYRDSIRRADVVHVPSGYTARRIQKHVPEARGKIFTCPLFLPPVAASAAAKQGAYFHYPAIGWPHKNHALLFEAFAKARRELPVGFRLVLTGNRSIGSVDLQSLASKFDIADVVEHRGFRPRGEVLDILAGSMALVFPSLYEGFGFPLVEAMALERPMIASNNTSITEIAGPAALLLPPEAGKWAEAMQRIVHEPELRHHLVDMGRRRRGRFTEEVFFENFHRRIAG